MPQLPSYLQLIDPLIRSMGVALVVCTAAGLVVVLLAAVVLMVTDRGGTPRCTDCGESLEEGRDMALEDDFDPPDRAA